MTMGAQIPVIAEKPLAACGCRKFHLDAMGDHLCTCKTHDWVVEQLADLFRATHATKIFGLKVTAPPPSPLFLSPSLSPPTKTHKHTSVCRPEDKALDIWRKRNIRGGLIKRSWIDRHDSTRFVSARNNEVID
jgi:hypothetical protein